MENSKSRGLRLVARQWTKSNETARHSNSTRSNNKSSAANHRKNWTQTEERLCLAKVTQMLCALALRLTTKQHQKQAHQKWKNCKGSRRKKKTKKKRAASSNQKQQRTQPRWRRWRHESSGWRWTRREQRRGGRGWCGWSARCERGRSYLTPTRLCRRWASPSSTSWSMFGAEGLQALSASQIGALEELHFAALRHLSDAKVEIAKKQLLATMHKGSK